MPWKIMALVLAGAVVVQAAFLALALRTTGHLDGFAFRSVDSQEFMGLARNIARHGRFTQDEAPPYRPDTWRCPGYPLLLAACIGVFGEGSLGPVIIQQVIAVANVTLLVLIASQWVSARRAAAVGLLWLLDPYRGYYALWLLSETWFTFLLLLAAGGWQRWWLGRRGVAEAAVPGLLVGMAVLTRPIGAVLVPILLFGTAVVKGRFSQRLFRVAVCLAGLVVMLGPWMVRNKLVGGRFALSHQGGTVLTYYKAMEVVLWANGQSHQRYNPDAVHSVWEQFDQRLRRRWSATHGPLLPEVERDIAWPQLAWGRVRAVNPLALDRETMRVGLDVLREHPAATVACWAERSLSLLTFPLTLVIEPPATMAALPFAAMMPNLSVSVRRVIALLFAAPFVLLTLWATWGAIRLTRSAGIGTFAFFAMPALALVVATSPQLDPRFRIPVIPFLLLLAACRPQKSSESKPQLDSL